MKGNRKSRGNKKHLRYFVYLLTAFMLVVSFWNVIPNLSTDRSDYSFEAKTLASTQINIEKYRTQGRKGKREVLVLNMEDGTQWECSKQHFSKYWDQLQAPQNIGKTLKLYLPNNSREKRDPRSIEIDGAVIYDFDEKHFYHYFVLIVTGLFLLLSNYLHRRAEV